MTIQRWYDRDPALKQAMESLRQAPDRYSAQVALNIIMIVIEHAIEADTLNDIDQLIDSLQECRTKSQRERNRRWYDVNATLKSALQLLQDCPEEIQPHVIPMVCQMVEESLNTSSGPSQ